MGGFWQRVLCLAIGYGLGCIQFAYIICKKVKGVDIRNYGSGNSGTTNVMRVLGKKWGLTVLVLDILKGVMGPFIACLIFGYSQRYLMLWAGLGVILGHCYPCWMHFKGGKGVAASIGVFAICTPIEFCIAGATSLIVLYFHRVVSFSSLLFAFLLAVLSIFFYHDFPHGTEMIVLIFLMSVHTFYTHRANIRRIKNGTEPRMGNKVSVDKPDENKPDENKSGENKDEK